MQHNNINLQLFILSAHLTLGVLNAQTAPNGTCDFDCFEKDGSKFTHKTFPAGRTAIYLTPGNDNLNGGK